MDLKESLYTLAQARRGKSIPRDKLIEMARTLVDWATVKHGATGAVFPQDGVYDFESMTEEDLLRLAETLAANSPDYRRQQLEDENALNSAIEAAVERETCPHGEHPHMVLEQGLGRTIVADCDEGRRLGNEAMARELKERGSGH